MSLGLYKIAVQISLVENVARGLARLSKHFVATNKQAEQLQARLTSIGKMTLLGGAVMGAGLGGLRLLDGMIKGGEEYTRQLSLMNAAGFQQVEIAHSVAAAWKTSGSVITSSAADNLRAIRELRSAFGAGEGMQHAYAVLPQVERAQAITDALSGRHQDHVAFDMVKAIEYGTKGAVSVDALMKQSEMMIKALNAFGGTLTVQDFHQTLKQTKAAAPYLSDHFKYEILPTLMQEFKTGAGGSSTNGAGMAGTAIATLFGTIKGHAIQAKNMQNWIDAGLIPLSMIQKNPHSRTMSKILPGGIVGENEFAEDPYAWVQKYLIPARDRYKATKHVDDIGFYYALTGNRNSAFMMQTLANKGVQIQRDIDLMKRAPSSQETYDRLLKSNPQLAQQALEKQWQNIEGQIAFSILPVLVPLMVDFAKGLNSIAETMRAHPFMTKLGVGAFAGFSALLTFAGSVIIFAQAWKLLSLVFFGIGPRQIGLVGYALRGLFLSIGALPWVALAAGIAVAIYAIWKNWNKNKDVWWNMRNELTLFYEWLVGLAKKIGLISANAPPPKMQSGDYIKDGALYHPMLWGLVQSITRLSKQDLAALQKQQNPSAYVKPAAAGHAATQADVYLDGHKVGKVIGGRMSKAANRPLGSSVSTDPRRGFPQVATP